MKKSNVLRKITAKSIVILLIFSLVMGMLPIQQLMAVEKMELDEISVKKTFQDIDSSAWYYDDVLYVEEKRILKGTGDNQFSPLETMTRAMYVVSLGRMAGIDMEEFKKTSFIDVDESSWYAPYVEWAASNGITTGTGDGYFSPDVSVSREQMATMFVRYFEKYNINYGETTTQSTLPKDLDSIASWARDSVLKLWRAGLFIGDAKGNFNPQTLALRAEAAVAFKRSNPVVENWKKQNEESVKPPVESVNYTITFNSNGGTEVDKLKIKAGEKLTSLPAPTKEGYFFQGWFRDEDLSYIFVEGSTVDKDTTLYAKYADKIDDAVQYVPSYSEMNVSPKTTITILDTTKKKTVSEIKDSIEFIDTANAEFDQFQVTGSNGIFKVSSAREDGKFVEGHTYKLTLTDDKLTFQNQDVTTRVYVFSVKKQEVMEIALNSSMIYLPFEDVLDMKLDGETVASPSISLVSSTVGDEGNSLSSANSGSGTFVYEGNQQLEVEDVVAIYEGIAPNLRTVETDNVDSGDIAYVYITKVNGSTYSYENANAEQVLPKPDVLPISVDADKDGDSTNYSIEVEQEELNYSDSSYKEIGLDELTTVDVGDFIGFYTGEFAQEGSEVIGYGRIQSVTYAAEMVIITYSDVTMEDIEKSFNIYQEQAIDGEFLLSDEEIAKIEKQMEQEALDSGFVADSADYLAEIAMQTNSFKELTDTMRIANDKINPKKVRVENLTVVASIGTTVKNITGKNSGVSAKLQVGADVVIRMNEESNLVIHLSGTFTEEMSLDLSVNGESQGHWKTKWGIPYWYVIDDYIITTNFDAYTYTGINITAEIATVERQKLEDALFNWNKEKDAGNLGKVMNIAAEIKALVEGVQDNKVATENLQKKYKEMLENDTDWVPLLDKKLVEKSFRVALGVVEIKFEAKFVVSANVNLSIGADFSYKSAKRYSTTIRVISFSGSNETVELPGDGDYQFTFNVMGTLGLRAGVQFGLKAGIGSVKLNNIGVTVEPGAYIKLWGYFLYDLRRINNDVNSTYMGALLIELGMYLDVNVGVEILDGQLKVGAPLYENTWPLFTVGQVKNVYDFAYAEGTIKKINLSGRINQVKLSELMFTMNMLDLKDGKVSQQSFFDVKHALYNPSNFNIYVDNENFVYHSSEQTIKVKDTSVPVSEGNIVIVWNGAPLQFSSTQIKRTIPIIWLAREGAFSIQVDPQNGEMPEIITESYNTKIDVKTPVRAGYTFNGWYTEATGGQKVTIPSNMPAEDKQYFAHWIANTGTAYTVEHYLIDPNTRESKTPVLTENLTGVTDTEIKITSNQFEVLGYAEASVKDIYIKGDGSTVVRLEYYPKYKTVTFDLGYTGSPRISISEPFGKLIANRLPAASRQGYIFNGWSPEFTGIMPTIDTTYKASWIAKDDTSYQIMYLQQNIGSDTYSVVDKQLAYGTTDTKATLTKVVPNSYEGFSLDLNHPDTLVEDTIVGEGSTVLKLYYKRNSYKLALNYDTEELENKEYTIPYGATTKLYMDQPTRQAYDFVGWTTTAPTTMLAHNIELIAQWQLKNFTVTFDNNGGSNVDNQVVDYGAKANVPSEPIREGYNFVGWYMDRALNVPFDFNTTEITGDLQLYAKWTIKRYGVGFHSNEGSVIANQQVNHGEKVEQVSEPTREGYTFLGWYTDSSLTTIFDFTETKVTSDIQLYAKWKINSYTVHFESNTDLEIDSQTLNYGSSITEPSNLTREGYHLDGWYMDSDLTVPYDFETYVVRQDVTLYAKWTAIYTVHFDSNGGSIVEDQEVLANHLAVSPTHPTLEGYVFGGWYVNSELTEVYNFTTSAVTRDMTLYAKWTVAIKNKYTLTFNSNNGSSVSSQTVEEGAVAVVPDVPTLEGYSFVSWYSDASLTNVYGFTEAITSDVTLYAKWKINSYTVNFVSNNGILVDSQTLNYNTSVVEPMEPTREGYTFNGWYVDSELTETYDFANSVVTRDMTLYAKWTINRFSVSFESYDGTQVDSQTVDYNRSVVEPMEPTRENYTFDGWYVDSGLTIPYNFTTSVVTSNITLYAKWNIITYTVVFNKNDGSEVESQTVNHGNKAEVIRPTREGYRFAGWYTNSSLTVDYDFETLVTSNVLLYAKWLKLHTVSFESNGGSSVETQTVVDNTYLSSNNPTRDGYRFVGWYFDAQLTEAYNSNIAITSDLILYAKWQSSTITVTFNSNGGPAVASVVVDSDGYMPKPVIPEWEGYTFEGWFTDLSGTTEFENRQITSDMTLYALWTKTDWYQVADTLYPEAYALSNIAVDKNNNLYVAYVKDSDFSIVINKYANGVWETMAEGDTIGGTSNYDVILTFDNDDNLYATFVNLDENVEVKKYNGTTWETIGSIEDNGVFPSMVFDEQNTPYLAYRKRESGANNIFPLRVVKFDGTNWIPITNGLDVTKSDGLGALRIDSNGNLYLLYSYRVNARLNYEQAVEVYKYVDNTWTILGENNIPNIISGQAFMELDNNGVPYVGYNDGTVIKVMKYNGVNWEYVGNTDAYSYSRTAGTVGNYSQLTFDQYNIPYLTFVDALRKDKATVIQYDAGTWNYVSNSGFTNSIANYATMGIDHNNNIYVTYLDDLEPDYYVGEFNFGANVHLLKYDPNRNN